MRLRQMNVPSVFLPKTEAAKERQPGPLTGPRAPAVQPPRTADPGTKVVVSSVLGSLYPG